jgi:hypothetical protein
MRHDERAKKNRWPEKVGLLPEGASNSRSITGVLEHMRVAARHYFHRLVSMILFITVIFRHR